MAGRESAAEEPRGLRVGWAKWNERAEIGRWVGALAAEDASYISHGEIQTGLSTDGKHWIANVGARIAADIGEDTPEARAREIAVARAADGALFGASIVLFELEEPARFAVIEDMVVAPAARSLGIGAALMRFVEAAAKARGAAWVFLESGLRNERAHVFFERENYAPLSKVFGKKLD